MTTIKVTVTKSSFANKVLENISRQELEDLVNMFISLTDGRDVGELNNLGLTVDDSVEVVKLRNKIFSIYE